MWASQVTLMVKNPSANARDIRYVGSIPGSGRSFGGEHSNPLQYSCLENPMDRGAWWATIHRVTKSQTWLKHLSSSSSWEDIGRRIIRLQSSSPVTRAIASLVPESNPLALYKHTKFLGRRVWVEIQSKQSTPPREKCLPCVVVRRPQSALGLSLFSPSPGTVQASSETPGSSISGTPTSLSSRTHLEEEGPAQVPQVIPSSSLAPVRGSC